MQFLIRCRKNGLFLLFLLVLFSPNISQGEDAKAREGRIKAASLYYIAKFITWPESSPQGSSKQFNLCIAGENPLNEHIRAVVDKKSIRDMQITLHFIEEEGHIDTLTSCHLLFLGDLKESFKLKLREKTASPPVLTIVDVSKPEWGDFDVQLFEQDNKLRIAIDLPRVTVKNLRVSSELLQLSLVRRE